MVGWLIKRHWDGLIDFSTKSSHFDSHKWKSEKQGRNHFKHSFVGTNWGNSNVSRDDRPAKSI